MNILNFIITYSLEFLFGLIISFIAYLTKKLSSYYTTLNYTKDGVKVLLKGEIIRRYYEYKNQKYITLYDKEILNDLYSEYKSLGGNGIIEGILKEIEKLPILNGGD